MTDRVNAVVNLGHRVLHIDKESEQEVASTPASGVISLTKAEFEEAEKTGAVRKATAEDKADAEVAVGGAPPAAPSVEEQAAAARASAGDDLLADDTPTRGRRG